MKDHSKHCPICAQSKSVVSILYGMPDPGLLVGEEEFILGGCIMTEDQPEYYCKHCKITFDPEGTVCERREAKVFGGRGILD